MTDTPRRDEYEMWRTAPAHRDDIRKMADAALAEADEKYAYAEGVVTGFETINHELREKLAQAEATIADLKRIIGHQEQELVDKDTALHGAEAAIKRLTQERDQWRRDACCILPPERGGE